jgi:hypothetical protein
MKCNILERPKVTAVFTAALNWAVFKLDASNPHLLKTPPPPQLPTVKSKGKAIPLQALRGPEGSRKLRLPDFKTIGT